MSYRTTGIEGGLSVSMACRRIGGVADYIADRSWSGDGSSSGRSEVIAAVCGKCRGYWRRGQRHCLVLGGRHKQRRLPTRTYSPHGWCTRRTIELATEGWSGDRQYEAEA